MSLPIILEFQKVTQLIYYTHFSVHPNFWKAKGLVYPYKTRLFRPFPEYVRFEQREPNRYLQDFHLKGWFQWLSNFWRENGVA